MKILLIGNYPPDRQESMLRFTKLLETELRARGHRVQLLQPRARLNRAGAPPSGRAKWLGYLDKFALFPALLKRAARRADIVHITDHSNAMYVRYLKNKPLLLTCNDVLAIRSALGMVPQNPTGASGKVLQKLILRGLNRAPHIACISENTRQQLLEVSSRAPDQTEVIEMGLNYDYSPMPAEQAMALIANYFGDDCGSGGIGGADSESGDGIGNEGDSNKGNEVGGSKISPFVLHVGGNQWYKNREGVLRIYAALREQMGDEAPKLVMVGPQFSPAMEEIFAEHKLRDVVRVQDASNEELRAFYSLARAFIFPSLAEGFGWPIVEAQACGARVLTTDLPPMNDIGGDAAATCDPAAIEAAAETLRSLLCEDKSAQSARIEAGLRNARRFTTAHMIDQYERLYQQILGA